MKNYKNLSRFSFKICLLVWVGVGDVKGQCNLRTDFHPELTVSSPACFGGSWLVSVGGSGWDEYCVETWSLDTVHPFPFDSVRTYDNLNTDTVNQNFIGIKLGDVNNTWDVLNPRLSVAREVQFAMEEYHALSGDESSFL